MKKIISLIMAAVLILGVAAIAETTTALDAFNALTGQQVRMGNPEKSNAEYLAEIMDGVYAIAPTDFITAADMAAELTYLTCISNRDIAAFASDNRHPVVQVRNAYYMALANCLRAEFMINPASEDRYKNIQMILALFLEEDETKIDYESREAIRSTMTPESAAVIAREYNLPRTFVEFVIMNDNWQNDLLENNNEWQDNVQWNGDVYEDSADDEDDLKIGDRDTAKSSRVAELQERLIALGYLTGKADGVFGPATQSALLQYQLANGKPASGSIDADDMGDMFDDDTVARWDYEDSFDYDDSPDNSPDYDDSVDYDNSPDNSPDYDDSVDYDNSPDNSPDYDDSPEAQDSPDYDDSPEVQDSPDYDDSPEVQDSPDYDDSPEVQDSPDYEDSPEVNDSPDYEDSPEADDSPDYEDSPDNDD